MGVDGWKYYNCAAVPTNSPDAEPNMSPVINGDIWSGLSKKVWLVVWTTGWDMRNQGNWWYVIKDDQFNINNIKAKKRYEIKKGQRNFVVRQIKPDLFKEEILNVSIKAYEGWPIKYRPDVDRERLFEDIDAWGKRIVFGGFDVECGDLCSYAILEKNGKCISFSVLRTDPLFEKKGINAVMVYSILEFFREDINSGSYICDGSRSIRHETAFQEYLIRYFGFRKAYCKLNIIYKFPLNILVNLLYPFRRFIGTDNSITSKISALLKMEECARI